jgi:hypothetical protein
MFVGRCFCKLSDRELWQKIKNHHLRPERPWISPKSQVPTLHTNQNQRNNAKGAPGLAFETWDPRNTYLMDTRDVTTGTQTRQNLSIPIANRTPATSPSPCHPERTRISYLSALAAIAYVVLLKENHMLLAEAAALDRKSGIAEGSAVPRAPRGTVFTEPLPAKPKTKPRPRNP